MSEGMDFARWLLIGSEKKYFEALIASREYQAIIAKVLKPVIDKAMEDAYALGAECGPLTSPPTSEKE